MDTISEVLNKMECLTKSYKALSSKIKPTHKEHIYYKVKADEYDKLLETFKRTIRR